MELNITPRFSESIHPGSGRSARRLRAISPRPSGQDRARRVIHSGWRLIAEHELGHAETVGAAGRLASWRSELDGAIWHLQVPLCGPLRNL